MAYSVSLIRKARGKGKPKSRTWTMVWRDETGKIHQESTGTRDRDVAKKIRTEKERQLVLAANGLADPFIAHSSMTWADARERFRSHCDKKYAKHPDTIGAISFCLDAFERLAAPKLLRDCTTKMLLDFAAARLVEVVAATVNKDLRHVRLFLRWCHSQHFLRTLPEFKLAFLREDFRLPVVVAPEAVQKLVAAIDQARLRHRSAFWWLVFVTIAHKLGPRRGEILGLRWGAVNFRNLTVFVASTISKGRRDRLVPIELDLAALLAFWWQASGEPDDDAAVLPWEEDDARKLYDDWAKVCRLAGVKAAWKNLRSTFGSELLNSGTPSVVVRDMLGHSSVMTTEKHYLAPSQQAMRDAIKRRNGGGAGGNAQWGSQGPTECA